MNQRGSSRPVITGVLLAAGRSRRMGTTKQLLAWPPGADNGTAHATVVEAAFDAIAPHCDRMIVVLGHDADAIRAALVPRHFDSVITDPDAEMIDSIKCGLRQTMTDEAMSCVLLHPADHPEVSALTVRTLAAVHASRPECAVMPEYQGTGGHPALIPRSLIGHILKFTGGGGLRAFWTANRSRCVRVPVNDPNSVLDLDTVSDYECRHP